jgi:hypothetical protein
VAWLLAALIVVVGFGIAKSYAPHVGELGEEEFDWAGFTLYASIAAAVLFLGYVASFTLEAIAALGREQRRVTDGLRSELTTRD